MKRVNHPNLALPPLEQSLVTALRLATAGDRSSLLQLARNLVASPPEGVADIGAFREALGAVLVTVGARGELLRRGAEATPMDSESRMPLVRASQVDSSSARPILNPEEERLLMMLLAERRRADELIQAGLSPTRTVLLTGPPGVGKTMTARYVAADLGLELIAVDLAAIMSSFLGRTGQNVRAALEHARQQPAVTLVDEFDALAKRRDDEADVGELKRIVNVLLLELEDWPAHSLLIAATNHPTLLDPAIGRRFDLRIDIGLPELDAREALVRRVLERLRVKSPADTTRALALTFEGFTPSDLVQVVERTFKDAVLEGAAMDQKILDLLATRIRGSSELARATFALLAQKHLGLSNRAIASHLGVTHPTVARLIRLARASKAAN